MGQVLQLRRADPAALGERSGADTAASARICGNAPERGEAGACRWPDVAGRLLLECFAVIRMDKLAQIFHRRLKLHPHCAER